MSSSDVVVDTLLLRAFGEEVAAGFGLGELLTVDPGGAGAMGRIWRVRTAGDDVAVKTLYGATDADTLEPVARRENAFVELARSCGVLAPRPRTDTQGRHAVATALGTVRVADWVTGTGVTVHDPGAAGWAGRTMAVLTALPFPVAGTDEIDPWYTTPPTEERWATLAARATADDLPWAAELRRQVPALLDLADLAGRPPDQPLAWCHSDLLPQNAVRRRDGMLELIDWDEAGPVQPRWALARLLTDWCLDPGPDGDVVDQSRVAALVGGYRSAGGTAEPTSRSDFGGLVAGTLNFLAGQAELALGLGGADLVATGTEQVHRVLTRPLRASVFDAVLDAIPPATTS